jgi:heterodisulfide reductase subunit C
MIFRLYQGLLTEDDLVDINGEQTRPVNLRKIVLNATGQDVLRCHGCGTCNIRPHDADMDISLDSLIQLVIENDEEVLNSRTLWSDEVLRSIRFACKRSLNLPAVFLALRQEAHRRGMQEDTNP